MKNKINYLIVTFISFIIGGLSMFYFYNNNVLKSDTIKAPLGNYEINSSNNNDLSWAVSKVYDAVMMVNTYKGGKVSNTGSAFVYKTDDKYGYLLTNHHVVNGGNKWTLYRSDDKEIEASLLGSDEYLDLAVLRIDKNDVKSVANMGISDSCKLGENVFTVGSPLGYEYRGTVTSGIISGLNRMVEVSVNANNDWVMEVIQTNAAVNPGNSGGPLVNANGEVIGIISLKLVEDSVEGMGFAIPIEYAINNLELLSNGKKIDRPLLGISMMNTSDNDILESKYNIEIDDKIEHGIVIVDIIKDSIASKSNLQKGDIITKINNDSIKNTAYMKYILYKYKVGDIVELTYYRNGEYNKTKMVLNSENN